MKWKNEAIEKLRRYDAMRQALLNIPEELGRLQEAACAIRASDPKHNFVRGGGYRAEEALLNNLVEQQELENALKQVKRWLSVADRGLSALTNEEQLVLQRLYLYPERDALARLCKELGVEQSTVYRKRDQALERFTLALYGFSEI